MDPCKPILENFVYGSFNCDWKFLAKMREREKYEEENFTRISLTKCEQLMQKRLECGEFLGTSAGMDHIRKLPESPDKGEEMDSINPKVVAGMILGGPRCRLQTCSRLISERFNSALLALAVIPVSQIAGVRAAKSGFAGEVSCR
ncbi:unnamed protein product [Taenia asiatica]|uniref:Uncharacterized protein n=1 Tax=Taenia asiatica TaxID=60517 RepID=A0A0R3W8J0_TAEAS|nr:unnamed protein product [Taenia asiatica]